MGEPEETAPRAISIGKIERWRAPAKTPSRSQTRRHHSYNPPLIAHQKPKKG
jgi:hypothetical protein